MSFPRLAVVAVLVVMLGLSVQPLMTSADGVIVVDPPPCATQPCDEPQLIADQLDIRYHRVDVSIIDQLGQLCVGQLLQQRRPPQLLQQAVRHSARYSWMNCTAMLPSPTAEATRFTDRARTSPTAKTPGTLDSSR